MEAGVESGMISSTIERSFLFHLLTGVYVVGRRQITQEGLWAASLLATGEGSVLGGRTAATLWGFMNEQNKIDVLRVGGGHNQRPNLQVDGSRGWPYVMVRRTRSLPGSDVRMVNGLAVTSVARTLVDLAELLTDTQFGHAFMEADRHGLLVDQELLGFCSRSKGRQWGRLFDQLV